jgi:membrane fusion protein
MNAAQGTKSDLFRAEVLKHRSDSHFGDVSIASPMSTWLILALISAFALLLLAVGVFGTYRRHASARGWISTKEGVVRIRSTDAGTISAVFVEEGANAHSGDALFSVNLDTDDGSGKGAAEQSLAELDSELASVKRQQEAATREWQLRLRDLELRSQSLSSELRSLDGQLALQSERMDVARAQLELLEPMAAKGFVARTDLLRSRDELLSRRQDAQNLDRQREALESSYDQITREKERAAVESDTADAAFSERLSDVRRRRILTSRSKQVTIRSPVDGIVSAVVATIGKRTVPTADEISIVPAGAALLAVVYATSSEAGQIEAGQKAVLKLDSFPYQQYGVVHGSVASISKTSIQPDAIDLPTVFKEPVYRMTVLLDEISIGADGKTISLSPGMTLQAEVLLSRRQIWHALLDPLTDTASSR